MTGHDDPTYRTGDRVRTSAESWGQDLVPVGAVGTIISPTPLAVAFDHHPHGDGTGVWAMFAHQLTHLGRTPQAQARIRHEQGEPALLLYALQGHSFRPKATA